MEPLHGARPKWNHPERPTLEMEESRGLGAEATGGMDGTEGGMRAPAPQLPLPRQDMPGTGVVTPRGGMLTDMGSLGLPGHDYLRRGHVSISTDPGGSTHCTDPAACCVHVDQSSTIRRHDQLGAVPSSF